MKDSVPQSGTDLKSAGITFAILSAVVLAARLAHASVLWADDNLPLAAAIEVFRGRTLYRDVWYDKPPLVVWTYLLWAARSGAVLRLAGAIYVIAASIAAWLIARRRWSEREAVYAAAFTAFFLTFALPSAVIPLASDMLLILPHLLAIYFAWNRKPFWSGAAAGLGLLYSSKAIFVLAACVLWQWRSAPMLLAGFAAPNASALAWMWMHGSLGELYNQAWQWGSIYATHSFIENPVSEGLKRTANWIGFQAALVIGAILTIRRDRDWRFVAWIGLAFTGVVLGLRFFPRYYFLLLPPLILLGARGWAVLKVRAKFAILALFLAVPLFRFAPAYLKLPEGDLALDRDSRAVAAKLNGGTLFVWGFRPDIFIDSGLAPASRFLESQPISGVLADRHLFSTTAVAADFLEPNRAELIRSRPTWIVDGLGLLNPPLAISQQPYLREWLAQYDEVARTGFSILYRLR